MTYEYNKQWRIKHPDGRNAQRQRYYARTADAPHTRHRWHPVDDLAVLAHVETDHELAARLGRSVRAIQIRRSRLKQSSDQGVSA